jgi:uncharacterized membrane protein
MARLEKHLETWRHAGLISAEQLQQIQHFEASRPRRSWGVWGILGIGVTAVITGIISVIAANWDAIGDYTKLVSYFALQAGLSALLFRRRNSPGHVRELLITGCAVFVLAGIGLIGQVFHLRSDGWQGLLLWLALVLPLSLLAEGNLLPYLWVGAAWATSWIWAESFRHLPEASRWWMACAVPVLFAALGLLGSPASALARFRGACRVWGLIGLCTAGSLLANITWKEGLRDRDASIGVAVFWGCSLLGVLAAQRKLSISAATRHWLSALFLVTALGCSAPLLVSSWRSDVLGAVFFLAIWSAAAGAAAAAEQRRLFDLATVVIALRFVVIYFEVFGSLAATGFGLIVSGGVIIGIALVWHRLRARARSWLGAQP